MKTLSDLMPAWLRRLAAGLLLGAGFGWLAVAAEVPAPETTATNIVQDGPVLDGTALLLLVHSMSTPKAPIREYRP